jgi:hypothetical protein
MIRLLLRPTGFKPVTYGLEIRKPENVTNANPISYKQPENPFSKNFSENDSKIQKDLEKIINHWPALPDRVRQAIMFLISED